MQSAHTRRRRVLYVFGNFPERSETYMRTEIRAVDKVADTLVVAMAETDDPCTEHPPFIKVTDPDDLVGTIQDFKPDVLHSHWLIRVPLLAELAERTQVPFTVRSHSFDVLGQLYSRNQRTLIPRRRERLEKIRTGLNNDLCLGVLAFPFTVGAFEDFGVQPEKVVPCFPVVDYERFADRSVNGTAVMNTGAVLPKKSMEDYLDLARAVPEIEFNIYAMHMGRPELMTRNEQMGSPVSVQPLREHHEMPREYKRHRWLVYTASRDLATVGWPMAVAEAQASGVGVIMPKIRPDLEEYVGEAGFLVESISEAKDLVPKPVPEDKRELGFELARRSDISQHLGLLTNCWDKAD